MHARTHAHHPCDILVLRVLEMLADTGADALDLSSGLGCTDA